MRLLHVDPCCPDAGVVREAAERLALGDLVILPTDTVYGLAADPRVSGAEQALYHAKGRPEGKPVARLALDARQEAELDPDPSEVIVVERVRLDRVQSLILSGEINHALVVAAFAYLLMTAGGWKRPSK